MKILDLEFTLLELLRNSFATVIKNILQLTYVNVPPNYYISVAVVTTLRERPRMSHVHGTDPIAYINS